MSALDPEAALGRHALQRWRDDSVRGRPVNSLRTCLRAIFRARADGHDYDAGLSFSGCRLGKGFLRLLLKYTHRVDVWDRTIANARDAELGETFIRWHALHDHDIHG